MRKKDLNRLEILILETQAEIRELKNMMMNHITPNEIRKMMGLPPIESGQDRITEVSNGTD